MVRLGGSRKDLRARTPFAILAVSCLKDRGTAHTPAPRVALEQIGVPAQRIPDQTLKAITACVGDGYLSVSSSDRIAHACGKGYHDLVRLRRGDLPRLPDAVAFPSCEEALVRLLGVAGSEGVAILLDVDAADLVATAEAGILGPTLEDALGTQ